MRAARARNMTRQQNACRDAFLERIKRLPSSGSRVRLGRAPTTIVRTTGGGLDGHKVSSRNHGHSLKQMTPAFGVGRARGSSKRKSRLPNFPNPRAVPGNKERSILGLVRNLLTEQQPIILALND